jgi:uncharacterized repeat protein (TIGR03803 family)
MKNLGIEKSGFDRIALVKFASIVAVFCVAAAVASQAQTVTTLFRFNGTNGDNSGSTPNYFPLVQGRDGNFYGTTNLGGKEYAGQENWGYGTIFKITPAGKLTSLYSFCSLANCADGEFPLAGLVLASNGNFYGTTNGGGMSSSCGYPNGCGTVFEITTEGKFTTLYNFCSLALCADGIGPEGSLIQGSDGYLYGTTNSTVFKMTTSGELTTLHTFEGSDGAGLESSLVEAANRTFYGTSTGGGSHGYGTIFQITSTGDVTVLYNNNVSVAGGDNPLPNTLVQGPNGNLYGTTWGDGKYDTGSVFELTLSGKRTTLYSFCANCLDSPRSGLTLGSDGNFYGTAGEIYGITPKGHLTELNEGQTLAGLLQATNGNFYGMFSNDGNSEACPPAGCGTVFSLSTGLGPFVEANPNFAPAGRVIGILGNGLTGTTSVTFNGVAATFDFVSDTYIKAMVPSGATTGSIEVTTPSGTLTSNVVFHVLP